MKHLHTTLTTCRTALLIALGFMVSACSGCSEAKASPEELAAACEAGHSRAMELRSGTPTATDTLAMENLLLDVREREHRLRTHGHNDVAEAYINSFLATLDSVNHELAASLH